MTYPTLNRRHKVGLFLVLVAAGISFFFEASEKQTTGIILLGLAATWLVGTLSVRLLWLLSSFLACLVAIIVGGKPVVDDWRSFQESVQSYDRAVADLRAAVVKSRPLYVVKTEPLPRRSNESTGTTPAVDYDALAKKYGAISSPPPTIDWSNYDGTMTVFDYNPQARKWNIAAAPGWVPVEEPKAEAKKSPKQLSFPANVDEEELISTIQSQLLRPRPKFSFKASFISNPISSLIGLASLMAGMFSLAWFVRTVLRAKSGHAAIQD